MNYKEQIQELKNNAELAWASYGYFHFIGKKFKSDNKTRKNDIITKTDILDITLR